MSTSSPWSLWCWNNVHKFGMNWSIVRTATLKTTTAGESLDRSGATKILCGFKPVMCKLCNRCQHYLRCLHRQHHCLDPSFTALWCAEHGSAAAEADPPLSRAHVREVLTSSLLLRLWITTSGHCESALTNMDCGLVNDNCCLPVRSLSRGTVTLVIFFQKVRDACNTFPSCSSL